MMALDDSTNEHDQISLSNDDGMAEGTNIWLDAKLQSFREYDQCSMQGFVPVDSATQENELDWYPAMGHLLRCRH